ncbi:MAG: anthranilate synthase component I [Candidatus Omnitrophica bacterium]|nr:anthranilate synthase component I [Candidatus Omnitrophota bacterium]
MVRREELEYKPSLKEFLKLAKRGNVVPVYRQIPADFETPLTAYLKLQGKGPAYLLESVEGGERLGRYSFIGSEPSLLLSSKGRRVECVSGGKKRQWTTETDPFGELEKIIRPYRAVDLPELPRFSGGLVGFAGYDTVRFLEPVGSEKPDTLGVPDSVWMLSDSVVIFDHLEHQMKVVANAIIPAGPVSARQGRAKAAYAQAVRRIDRMIGRLQKPLSLHYSAAARRRKAGPFAVRANMSPARFTQSVRQAKRAIAQGEAIQIVLSQRFETPVSCRGFDIYRALRSVNPSPYMFYLNLGDFSLAGSSPEILVRCEEGTVEVRPIAGTRRRGKTPAADSAIEEGLKRDPKERAEHIMLADLGRNDVGRVCEYGSVRVSDLMTVERYSHVMHLVSDVTGRLRKGKNAFDVLRACFPAGTVTGAPKVRAMQIINTLEPDARGPYAGAVGYIGFNGNLDTCIAIRTVLIQGRRATVQAGAGIVADSQPRREYQETRNKAAGMLQAIALAEQGLE